MKKIILISAIAMMGAASLTGCSDFLDAENKAQGGQIADGYFGKDASELRVTAYNSIKILVNTFNSTNGFNTTDIYEWGTDLTLASRGNDVGAFGDYSLTSSNGDVLKYYTNCYAAIRWANATLQYGGEDSKYAPEMKFLRAYCYYMLTQQFGSVPLIKHYVNDAERSYPRTGLKEIYDFLIEDLTPLVTDGRLAVEDHNGVVSQRAVAALLSKINLAAGWDLGTTLTNTASGTFSKTDDSYFKAAVSWANKAIDMGAVTTLSMSFADKWSPFNEGNGEEIFSIQFDRAGYSGDASDGGHGLQNQFSSYYGEEAASGMKASSSMKVPSSKVLYLWDQGDERYDGTFMQFMYNSKIASGVTAGWGTEGYFAYYNVSDHSNLPIAFWYAPSYMTESQIDAYVTEHKAQFARGENINEPKAFLMGDKLVIWSFDAEGNFTKTKPNYSDYLQNINSAPCVRKWDDASTTQSNSQRNCYRDIVLLHLSDLYLVRAEAKYMSGDGTWMNDINAVRTRSGASTLGSFGDYDPRYSRSASFGNITELDLILDERARELHAENQRWMDLRRTRQLVRYNVEFNPKVTSIANMSDASGNVKWYRPIPANEIAANTGMTNEDQNPGY